MFEKDNRHEQLKEVGECKELMVKKVWNQEFEAAVEYCAQVIHTSAKKKKAL